MEFTVICKKCNKKVSTKEVRILPDKSYICFSCAGYTAPARTESEEKKGAAVAPMRKAKYQCTKCKYEFYIKEGHPKRCPYCGGDSVQEKQFEAQNLIDMPGKFREDE